MSLPNSSASSSNTGNSSLGEQKVSWLELFYDLVFVTAFDQLATLLTTDNTWHGLGVFAVMFTAIWQAWVGNTLFAGRYGNEGAAYRYGTALQVLISAGLSIGLLGDLRDVGGFFSGMYVLNRLVLLVMYLWQIRYERLNNIADSGSRYHLVSLSITALLWLAAAFLPTALQVGVWVTALILELLLNFLGRRADQNNLPHPEHLPERVGLLTLISLGAIITEIVGGAGQQRLKWLDQLPSLLTLLTTGALFQLYFNDARALPALLAHKDGRINTLVIWLYAHLPLTLALTALGVGMGHGIAAEGHEADNHERVTVALSLVVVFINLAVLRLISRHATGFNRLDRTSAGLLLTAGVMLLTIWLPLGTLPFEALTLVLCGLCMLAFKFDPATHKLMTTQEAVITEVMEGGEEDGDGQQQGGDPTPCPTPEEECR